MKKIVIVLIVIIFSPIGIDLFSQNNRHLTFKNIPITGKLPDFVNLMEKEGFNLLNTKNNTAVMEGRFVNQTCEIYVIATPKSNIVWKVVVYLPENNNWISIKTNYNDFKDQFRKKYGSSFKHYEFFIKPYYEGDGYEMQAIRNEKCRYLSIWDLPEGSIAVEISKYEQIKFTYEDKINGDKLTKEKSAQIQDDI